MQHVLVTVVSAGVRIWCTENKGRLCIVVLFCLQDKGSVGLYEPESTSSKLKSTSSNGADPANLKAGAELEKAIGQLPPEQQQQLGRLYMFLTQHPEAKIKLQNFGDVRRAMDNYQVCLANPTAPSSTLSLIEHLPDFMHPCATRFSTRCAFSVQLDNWVHDVGVAMEACRAVEWSPRHDWFHSCSCK